jgi:putative transposase
LRILREGIRYLGLLKSVSGLETLRKSDDRKAQLAILLRTHTTVSNDWIAVKLVMGHPGSVSRIVSAGRADHSMTDKLRELELLLIREQ